MPNVALLMYLAGLAEKLEALFFIVGIMGIVSAGIVFIIDLNVFWDNWNNTFSKIGKACITIVIISLFSLIIGIIMPSKDIIYVYAGQEVAEHIAENPTVNNEAKDIYKDLKTILQNIATEKKVER